MRLVWIHVLLNNIQFRQVDDKFLFTYVTLKLNLLRGKILIFCNSHRPRLQTETFILDQFGWSVPCWIGTAAIKSSRDCWPVLIDPFWHFNCSWRNSYSRGDFKKESWRWCCSGVDFKRRCRCSIDFPGSLETYTHRVGRTARGKDGKGTALSLIDVEADSEEAVGAVRAAVKWLISFPMDRWKLSVIDPGCPAQYHEIERKEGSCPELSKQLLASQKLSTSFFANRLKDFTNAAKWCGDKGKGARIQQHLKHVPGYLLESVGAKEKNKNNKKCKR